ncbi:hypothetical protein C0580_00415 [Candidatus Parcubacteria bacterium]|nr:MAG: hypothetical protein C0580_00415 [Candidatus Parcubacteria bacterium]
MAKDIIGIDISDSSIEAIVLDKKKGNFVVEAFSRYRLSPDIVEDGKILDFEKLKEAIKGLLVNAKPGPIQSKKVFLSIPESKVFTKVIYLPKNIKGKNLDEAIQHKAEEQIPESFDKLIPATKILPDIGDKKQVLYAAAELEIVNDFLRIFNDLGMEVVGIVPESLSSFAGLDAKLEKKMSLMLDIGSRTTIATIFDKNGIRHSINIDIGGDKVTRSIAQKLEIPYTQAEEKMKTIGLTPDGDGETMLIIQGQLQPLVDEIKRFLAYYQETNNEKIEQVILIGGLAQMKGAASYFGDNLALTAIVGEPFIAHENLPDFVDSTTFINVLGLAKLSDKKLDLNFLTDNLLKKLSSKKPHKKNTKSEDAVDSKPKKPHKKIDLGPLTSKLKEIFGNKLFIIFTVVLILFILLLIFKDKILPPSENAAPINANQSVTENNTNNSQPQEIVPIKEVPEQVSYDFVVGISPNGGEENFILAEYYNLVISKQFSDPDMSFADLRVFAGTKINEEVLSQVNIKYQKEGYLILPVVSNSTTLSLTPTIEEYEPGDTMTIKDNYTLLAVPKDKVLAILKPKLLEFGIEDFDQSKFFDSIFYTFQGYDANSQVYNVKFTILISNL